MIIKHLFTLFYGIGFGYKCDNYTNSKCVRYEFNTIIFLCFQYCWINKYENQ